VVASDEGRWTEVEGLEADLSPTGSGERGQATAQAYRSLLQGLRLAIPGVRAYRSLPQICIFGDVDRGRWDGLVVVRRVRMEPPFPAGRE
jgi:hypothetical protein